MADTTIKFLRSLYFTLLCLVIVFNKSPSYAGCPRTRCSGTTGLRRDFRRNVDLLSSLSRLLAPLTVRAINHTKVDYGVSDFCDPTCTSPADVVMKDMNLKRTNWSNTSRSDLLEFHRRVFLDFNQQVTNSLAELARAQNKSSPPVYLKNFQDMMDQMKRLVPRVVNIDRKLKGLTLLNPTSGQQSSSTATRNATLTSTTQSQSLSSLACHFSGCVLENLLIETYQMIIDFNQIRNSL